MKPTVPETGRVIKLDGDMAVVQLQGGHSCKGCGAAAIGLCKPLGGISTLTVKNSMNAAPGDTVKVSLDKAIQRRGFLLAYIIPIFCFLAGSVSGLVLGREFSIPSLEVTAGFSSLLVAAFFSYRKLKKLDNSSVMTIKEILSRNVFSPEETGRPFLSQ
jgi:positive regulator of sigma E activity